jgi:hypothetical protein
MICDVAEAVRGRLWCPGKVGLRARNNSGAGVHFRRLRHRRKCPARRAQSERQGNVSELAHQAYFHSERRRHSLYDGNDRGSEPR